MKNPLRTLLLLGGLFGLLGNAAHAMSYSPNDPDGDDTTYTTHPEGDGSPKTDSGSTDDNTPPPPPPSGYGGTVWHDSDEQTSDWEC
jgi:hypothetical protein